jgi:CRP/FNR family transcriptional regulator
VYSADSTERPTPARASDPGLRALGPSARETLRNLLRRIAPGFQVAPTAIDLIVEHAQVTNWRAGQKIVAPGDPSDFVYFLVGGAVRLDLQIGGRWLTAGFVPAGNFIGSALPSVRREFPFAAVAHVPSLIALVSHDTMRRTFERLRPEVVYRIVANEVARLQSLVVGKTRLLASPLQDRLTSELAILARDFGRPGSDGILIDLPLIHRDLAQLVVASRANVTRALCALRHAGTIDLVSRRILLRCPANDR